MRILAILSIMAFVLQGCSTTENYAAGGAAGGALLGGIIGNNSGSGKHSEGGMIAGAVVGGLAGALLGKSKEGKPAEQIIVECPSCTTQVDVTGFPRGSEVQCPKCNSIFSF